MRKRANSDRVYAVNVRALAEFSLLRGDLAFDRAAADRMREGAEGHRALQALLEDGWTAEEWVSRAETVEGLAMKIQGRADAVRRADGTIEVREIKTTRLDPRAIRENDYPVHWAQAEIYAYLFCANEALPGARVTLVYYHASGVTAGMSRDLDADALREKFLGYAVPYALWARKLDDWQRIMAQSAREMAFPYPAYRDGQRRMAGAVYRALNGGGQAMIEAPTGIGKTAAALFGAIKALGEGHPGPVFYLTARTTGRRAAEDALSLMREKGLRLRAVTITAKEKICPEGMDCMGCPMASGYFDRRGDALRDGAETEVLDEAAVRDLAREHSVCPFELSLDLSEIADCVICDYNYAFDPRVRIKRFFDGKSGAALLVDEAHNLPDRARDMLSCALSPEALRAVTAQMLPEEGENGPFARAAAELMRAFRGDFEQPEAFETPDAALGDAAERFAKRAMDNALTRDAALWALEAERFGRMTKAFDAQTQRLIREPEADGLAAAKIWTFDPSEHLRAAFSRVDGAALFSATLSPMHFYARTSGVDRDAAEFLNLPSPFPPENLLVLRLNLPTTLRERARTLEAVARAVHALGEAHAGNYIACFPSHAYLNQAFERFRMLYPDEKAVRQTGGMSESARRRFIAQFEQRPKRSLFAFIALGGVFSEGVDLPDDRLSGAAVISAGIPQISLENEILREMNDDGDSGGYDFAYVYPGLRRVFQAAGRVIRTERDRGTALLIDTRFTTEKYRELMPEHWQIEDVKSMSGLKKRLSAFWRA